MPSILYYILSVCFYQFQIWYLSTSVSFPNIDNPLLFFPFVHSPLSLSLSLSFRFSLAFHVIPFNKNAFSTSTQFPALDFTAKHTHYIPFYDMLFFFCCIFSNALPNVICLVTTFVWPGMCSAQLHFSSCCCGCFHRPIRIITTHVRLHSAHASMLKLIHSFSRF